MTLNIRLGFKVASICPIDKKMDVYDGIIEYRPVGEYIELNSFSTYLSNLRHEEYLCEDLAKEIYNHYNQKHRVNRVVLEENSPGIGIRVEYDG